MKKITTNLIGVKKGVLGVDKRWRASRMENVTKNRGVRMIKKQKKARD